MSGLPIPWAGLVRHAPRLPTELAELAPAGADAMMAALPPGRLRDAVLDTPPEAGTWLRADDPAWPARLVGLPGGPLALSLQGDPSLLAAPGVALVGTRHCTPTGRRLARDYAVEVARAGAVVVSGLAAGIDLEAHLAAGGRTIAVLGQGLLARMPAWQARMRARILAQGGLVVSEYPQTMGAAAWTFPRRNRIIAALAVGVVVVEAGHRSGAKNTAHHAAAYGREVAAVPGPPGVPSFEGCLDLLEEGATVARGAATLRGMLGLGSAALSGPP